MADNNKRQVQLDVAVTTSGADAIEQLANDLRGLAKAGDDQAPGLQHLADELEQAAAKTRQLSDAERTARAEVQQQKAALDAQRDALARMRAEATSATRNTAEFQAAESAARVAIIEANATLREKRAALAAASAAAKEAAESEKRLSAQARDTLDTFKKQAAETKTATDALASAFSRLGVAIGGALTAREAVETIARAESLQRALAATAGSAEAGRQTFEYLRQTSNALGLEFFSTADAFKSFSAATRGTALEGQQTRDAFEALANAASKLGLSTNDTEAAFRAVAQTASKGTVSMEELRGQLGEALPGAMQAAARGAGVTTERLVAMVETGKVLAKDFIPALTRGLNQLYKDGTPPDTMTAAWNRFKNTFAETAIALGEGGAGQGLTKAASAASVAVAAVSETFGLAGTALGSLAGAVRTGSVDFSQLRERADEADKRLNNLAQTAGIAAPDIAKVGDAAQDAATRVRDAFRAAEHAPEALKPALRDLELEFDTLRGKGESAADAVQKIAKAADIGTPAGIVAFEAALTNLKNRGEITAAQMREALVTALDGIDFSRFQALAEKAFAGTTGEARKLQTVLDAAFDATLRKFGTTLQEVGTGTSSALLDALKNVNVLVDGFDRLAIKTADTARAISAALAKALDEAGTTRAVQAVIDKYDELGKQGLISGDQLAAGMEKARQKLDDLKQGVNTVDEALRTFNLQTLGDLKTKTEQQGAAFQLLLQGFEAGKVSLADLSKAFEQYADTATRANGGIEPGIIKTTRAMLGFRDASIDAGKSTEDAMQGAGRSIDALTTKLQQAASASASLEERNRRVTEESAAADKARADLNHTAADNTGLSSLQAKKANGTLGASDLATAQAVYDAAKANLTTYQQNSIAYSAEGAASAQGDYNAARQLLALIKEMQGTNQSTGASTTHVVTINLPNGKSGTVNTASAGDASNLADLLSQLSTDARRAA